MEGIEYVPMLIYTGEPEPEQPHREPRRMTPKQYNAVMRAISHGMPMRRIAEHAHVSISTLRHMIARYHIEN